MTPEQRAEKILDLRMATDDWRVAIELIAAQIREAELQAEEHCSEWAKEARRLALEEASQIVLDSWKEWKDPISNRNMVEWVKPEELAKRIRALAAKDDGEKK